MATDEDTTPTLRQLLYTHEKLENLARGDLSRPVVKQIKDTARGIVLEIGWAQAQSWDDFHRKLAVLLDDWDDARAFLDIIRDDVGRLICASEMAQAAE